MAILFLYLFCIIFTFIIVIFYTRASFDSPFKNTSHARRIQTLVTIILSIFITVSLVHYFFQFILTFIPTVPSKIGAAFGSLGILEKSVQLLRLCISIARYLYFTWTSCYKSFPSPSKVRGSRVKNVLLSATDKLSL